jgi:hypothetical protein
MNGQEFPDFELFNHTGYVQPGQGITVWVDVTCQVIRAVPSWICYTYPQWANQPLAS